MTVPDEIDQGEASPPVAHTAPTVGDGEASAPSRAGTPGLDTAPRSTAAVDVAAPSAAATTTDHRGASKEAASDEATSGEARGAPGKPSSHTNASHQSIAAANIADAPPRVARHWPMMMMVFVLLAGAGLLVVFTALPAVARELGWTHARTVSRTTRRSLSAGHAGVDAVNERERKLALEGADDDDESPLTKGTQIAVSMQQTTLFKGPAASSGPVGSIERGERLVVVREDHGFYMVLHRGPAGTDMGWVRKSDVLVH